MRLFSRTVLGGVLLALGAIGIFFWAIRLAGGGAVPAAGPPDGAALYGARCAECHGTSGKGDGPGAALLRAPMPDFTNAAAMKQMDDSFLAQIIKKGGSQFGRSNAMPAWGMKLSDAQIQALVRHIRSLAGAGASAPSAGR